MPKKIAPNTPQSLPELKPKKSRSNTPIPSTLQTVKGLPDTVKLYKVPASDFYWVRLYDANWIKRSTRTTNKNDAIAFAKNFYAEWYSNKVNGVSIVKSNKSVTTFIKCAEAVIEENRQQGLRNELSASYVATQQQVIRNYITEFFKDYDIKDVDYAALNTFKTFLYDKDIKPATIALQFAALKKVINYAEMHKFIPTRPIFPKIKNDAEARLPFTEKEYIHLRRTARSLVNKKFEMRKNLGDGNTQKLRNIEITEEMDWLIGFMAYTFIRPSDLKTIQIKHLELRQKNYNYLFMPIPATKKHDKPIVSMPKAVYFYNRLLAYRKKQGISVSADDYLFMPQYKNRQSAYDAIARQFNKILEVADLKHTDTEINRSIYSLRHTAIMFLARKNTSIGHDVLAKNARTSTNMLDAHYLSTLENNDLADALHKKDSHTKKTKKKKAESKIFTTDAVEPDLTKLHMGNDTSAKLEVGKDGKVKIKR